MAIKGILFDLIQNRVAENYEDIIPDYTVTEFSDVLDAINAAQPKKTW
jgi:hypothetical protein